MLENCRSVFIIAGLFALNACSTGVGAVVRSSNRAYAISEMLSKKRFDAYHLFGLQRYEAAIEAYTEARRLAFAENNPELAIQFLNSIACSHYALSSYREAIRLYRQSIDEARRFGLPEMEALAALNISSLHLSMGEYDHALEVLEKYPLDGSGLKAVSRLDAFLIQANLFARLHRETRMREAFGRAIDESSRIPPDDLLRANASQHKRWPEAVQELRRALTYNVIGQCLTTTGHFAEAEKYTLDAFRLRATYREKSRMRDVLQLAMLRRSNGDRAGAASLLKIARSIDPLNRTPMHRFLLDREEARILLADGDFNGAIRPLRGALSQARSWRMEVLPSDATYQNFESYLTGEVHEAFLGAIAVPTFSLDQPGVAEESFWVAEEARFAAMRASQFPASQFLGRMPANYWTTLSKFQSIRTAHSAEDLKESSELKMLQRDLQSMEVEAGLSIPHVSAAGLPALKDWQRQLPADEAVFSFYLADPYSLAWTVTSNSISVRRLPGRKLLLPMIDRFRRSVMESSRNEISGTEMELTQALFGDFTRSHRKYPFWTLVLDQELSSLPIAALPVAAAPLRFLIEDHTIRTAPSAIFLRQAPASPWTRRAFGMADPIYNQADSRLSPFRTASATEPFQLNRLPSSAVEVDRSLSEIRSHSWTATTFSGAGATTANLRSTLLQSPDLIHISAHFIENKTNPNLLSVALSDRSLFTALDLNAMRTQTKLVVLSGCNSSTGAQISGIGINGLARAYLIAGVNTVVATLWPTLDSDGPIFPVFYRNLLQHQWSSRAAATSLRKAQLQMILNNDWSSKPSYWAAFIAISKG